MAKNDLKKWKTTRSEYLITDRWIRLRADSCVTPEGHTIEPYYVLEYPNWVNCVVLSKDLLEVTLLQHYRYGVDKFVLEIPGGIMDPGESPQETITRELEEELGLVGAEIYKTGEFYANPAMMTNINTSFVAISGTYKKQKLEPGDTFSMVKMPLAELFNKINGGDQIFQCLHLSAIFLALNYLKKQGYKLPQ